MVNLQKKARAVYCIGLAGMVLPQFYYGKFGGNFLPPWPGLPWVPLWAGLFTVVVLAACVAIVLEIKGRTAALLLAGLLLAMTIFGGLPYELFIDPEHGHAIYWAGLLSGLAITGGAFVVAGSFMEEAVVNESPVLRFLERVVPFGGVFFCITMIGYGYFHFLYPSLILSLFPHWIPFQLFWTYVAGAALMLCGLAVIFRMRVKLAGILLGAMIFSWLFLIHIPLAIADPWGNDAFQVIRIFGALAFTATAFLISRTADEKG
jgi:hypothetical protein